MEETIIWACTQTMGGTIETQGEIPNLSFRFLGRGTGYMEIESSTWGKKGIQKCFRGKETEGGKGSDQK